LESIDIDTWDRKDYFTNYLGMDFPYIAIGANIDITNLYNYTKQNKISFYFGMVYAANEIANQIKNFRYRFTDGKPYLIDYNRVVITHLQPGKELYVLVEGDRAANMVEFCQRTAEKAKQEIPNHGFGSVRGHGDIIIYSAIPWIQYTNFVRTIAKDGVDCNPKISWGKYGESGTRLLMPFSVQTHHGLMDGYHVGLYFQQLQSYLDGMGWL
jgi:chloramphenicol O-acetyltransferase type A